MLGLFKNFFGNSFLFSKTDARWREKRKGAAHAFYKDKLVVMLEETLKQHMSSASDLWLSQMQEGRPIRMDMSKVFLRIFQKFLMHILFGADIDAFTKVMIMARIENSHDYFAKECTLSEAIEETWEQTLEAVRMRLPNPIWNFLFATTGKCFSFTKPERVSD